VTAEDDNQPPRGEMTGKTNINWLTTSIMVAFHIGAIAALFMFSWKALGVALALYWVAGNLGIGMGYHRLLTHRGYKCPKWLEYFLTISSPISPVIRIRRATAASGRTWDGSSWAKPSTTTTPNCWLTCPTSAKTSSTSGLASIT